MNTGKRKEGKFTCLPTIQDIKSKVCNVVQGWSVRSFLSIDKK